MTKEELNKWCELQCDILAPFKQRFFYSYISKVGIHIWYSKYTLKGIPETAIQKKMTNGDHSLVGQTFQYKQTWKNGVMTSCIAIHLNDEKPGRLLESIVINKQNAWAVKRHVESALKAPLTWLKVSIALWLVVMIGLSSAWFTQVYQQRYLLSTNEKLTEAIGPKLDKRSELIEATSIINSLQGWKLEYYTLPDALGKVLFELNALSSVAVNRLQWQNKQLAIEFVANNIDIASLVENTQEISGVQNANIVPHNSTDTWVLEVQWN
ncbi:hypothetical protein GCM10007852_17850 [Agaribacter marinus]|uniref:Uncharacterized protein n=2 Tax=Agaribacter marinus TaxID=1431249 RepID=A0AA37WIE6_9ALTE|nr:hypothetical protein GCM10007852_17850 [Agaribacter marinus]